MSFIAFFSQRYAMATVSTNTTMSRPGYVDPNGTEAKHEVGEYPLARDYIDFTR